MYSLTFSVIKAMGHKRGPFVAASNLKKKIDQMKKHMALITQLRHPGVRLRHWELMFRKIGQVGSVKNYIN